MEKKVTDAYDLPGIVMIDEVATHLHLAMQRNVFKNLTELFPNIQFIVTTNSPFVLNSVETAVIYDLGSKLRVGSEAGLSKLPYSGIVEGYFGASELSAKLKAQFERYKELVCRHEKYFGNADELHMISAPGRMEIGGNHTDHNHGKVLAASASLDTLACVSKRKDSFVRVRSEGYPQVAAAAGR